MAKLVNFKWIEDGNEWRLSSLINFRWYGYLTIIRYVMKLNLGIHVSEINDNLEKILLIFRTHHINLIIVFSGINDFQKFKIDP